MRRGFGRACPVLDGDVNDASWKELASKVIDETSFFGRRWIDDVENEGRRRWERCGGEGRACVRDLERVEAEGIGDGRRGGDEPATGVACVAVEVEATQRRYQHL